MRLHTLTITAFGPFAGTEAIDMDRLTAGGLFLLEGPTGAGKSTVLDAIAFALYGRPAGSDSSADRLHSDFAAPETTPRVVLDFSVRGQRYVVDRVPEHERPKKRGTGTTTEKSSVSLYRVDGAAQELVSTDAHEVGAELTRLIGLNREQFTKVVLLPQGEFATFLRSDDATRRSLLTQIFGTWMYDRITSALESRRTEATRQREAAGAALGQAVAAAGAAGGLDEDAQHALVAAIDDDLAGAFDDVAAGLATAAADATGLERAAAQALASAEAELAARTAVHESYAALAGHRERVREHEASRPDHVARVAELAAARTAAPVGVVLRQLAAADAGAARALGDLLSVLPEPDEDERRGRGADAREAAARAADDEAAGLGHLVAVEAGLPARREALEQASAAVSAARATVDSLTSRQAELPAELAAAEAALAGAVTQAALVGSAAAEVQAATTRLDAARALVDLLPRLDDAIRQRDAAQRLHLQRRAIRLDLLERHLAGMAAVLAGQLVDGEPCAVCGSPVHPAPAAARDGHVSAAEVQAAADAEDAAERDQSARTREAADLDSRRAALVASCGGSDVPALERALREAAERLAAAESSRDAMASLRTRVDGLKQEQSSLADEITVAMSRYTRAHEARQRESADLERDQAAVEGARGPHATVHDRVVDLHAAAKCQRAARDALTTLAAAVALQSAKRDEAEAAAAAAGFESAAQAVAATRTDDEVAALDHAISAWQGQRAVLAREAEDPRFAGLDPDGEPVAAQRVSDASAERDRARLARDAAAARRSVVAARVVEFARHRTSVDRASTRRARVVADTAPVIRLAGLANGTRGDRRMTLTSYVLRQWFEQVVSAANVRLARMSAGRYELLRTDDAGSRAQKAGLSLVVIDRHTGDQRSPTSLSGGETFYTSLALALGLADVVRAEAGGVDLDTLFIDEGFGSLDPETLEMVMTVIDDLRDGGRAVGIVSHVADLKDRVTERLEVRRVDPQGPSRTEVVA